jgi:hypothetical protein
MTFYSLAEVHICQLLEKSRQVFVSVQAVCVREQRITGSTSNIDPCKM